VSPEVNKVIAQAALSSFWFPQGNIGISLFFNHITQSEPAIFMSRQNLSYNPFLILLTVKQVFLLQGMSGQTNMPLEVSSGQLLQGSDLM
jgi:hypothetical protein